MPPPPPLQFYSTFPIPRGLESFLYSAHTYTISSCINVPINRPVPANRPTHPARPVTYLSPGPATQHPLVPTGYPTWPYPARQPLQRPVGPGRHPIPTWAYRAGRPAGPATKKQCGCVRGGGVRGSCSGAGAACSGVRAARGWRGGNAAAVWRCGGRGGGLGSA